MDIKRDGHRDFEAYSNVIDFPQSYKTPSRFSSVVMVHIIINQCLASSLRGVLF